jgi:hypothetical protein
MSFRLFVALRPATSARTFGFALFALLVRFAFHRLTSSLWSVEGEQNCEHTEQSLAETTGFLPTINPELNDRMD